MGVAGQIVIPATLAGRVVAAFQQAGQAWLQRLPALIAQCQERWSLTVGRPFQSLSINYVAPAMRPDGSEVVLKVCIPNPEFATEAEALRRYAGRGSVRLLAVDHGRSALLLERLRPGLSLLSVADDEEATRIAAAVMGQLWRPAPQEHVFPTVGRWAAGLARMRNRCSGGSGPLPEALAAKAEGMFAELLSSMTSSALLHGDLHHENVLSAGRQPWLAIDPKGVVGEPAYEVGALLRNLAPHLLVGPQPGRVIARRADILAETLGFDRRRLLGWGFAQAILAAWWCVEEGDRCWERFIRHAQLIDEVMG